METFLILNGTPTNIAAVRQGRLSIEHGQSGARNERQDSAQHLSCKATQVWAGLGFRVCS